MRKGIFITGTDTDIGKTFVSALITKALRRRGIDAGYYKPAASGAVNIKGACVAKDAAVVAKIAALSEPPQELVSYLFEEEVSPHLAAANEGRRISLEKITADFHRHKKNHEFLVVEGAGGIGCPLNCEENPLLIADVIKALKLPAVIVANADLGTVNHAFLTAKYAQSQEIPLLGFIMNRYDKNNPLHRDNRKEIQALTGLPVLGCIKNFQR